MTVLALALVISGVLLLVLAAVGLFRLPDAMSRQHAATKSVTLALGLILVGAALHSSDGGFWIRVAAIVVLLMVTLPVASHMLARAAARHAYSDEALWAAPCSDPESSEDAPPRAK